MNSSRISAVVISFVYLFTPMLFSELPRIENKSIPTTSIDSELFGDLINGKGGPEENTLSIKDSPSHAFSEEKEDDQLVTTTKKVNYLKVADTVMPVDDPNVSSDYGWRSAPCGGCSSNHQGIDFTPGYGKPVFAVADGMIIDMGTNGGYGNFVRIQHLMGNVDGGIDEWITLYAHLKADSFPEELRIGAVVKSGERIGSVGSTGMSTGPHLHFELLINGVYTDPLPLLGTYEVVTVIEEEHDDMIFIGQTFTTKEEIVIYE